MTRIILPIRLLALVLLVVVSAAFAQGAAGAPPAPFTDTLVASVPAPIDLAVVERGNLRGAVFVTSKPGAVYLIPAGSGEPRNVLDFTSRTCSDGERGVLGIALDPRFGAGSNAIYLYRTASERGACWNRVSRFTVRASGAIDPASEQVLIQTPRLIATNHNGGDLEFGGDGYLYVSIGENARPPLAQRRNTFFGKILRITTTGQPAPGNPYRVGDGAVACGVKGRAKGTRCAEVFALGLRNPFQIAFAPGTNGFMINDVGQGMWEEIDRGRKGANYGWPEREGPCPQGAALPCAPGPASYAGPVAWYNHDSGCSSITAGAFVPVSAGWPAPYAGSYLVADFVCGDSFMLANPFDPSPELSGFIDDLGPVVAFEFDPTVTGSMLYVNLDGEVRRISIG